MGSEMCIRDRVDDLGCDVRRVQEVRLENLNFVTGTARMVKSSRDKFSGMIASLSDIKGDLQKVIVEGHTDSQGKASMNKRLSQQRADRVAELLSENLSIERSMIESFGYGEERPVANNNTRSGRLKNRRVQLRLIRKK